MSLRIDNVRRVVLSARAAAVCLAMAWSCIAGRPCVAQQKGFRAELLKGRMSLPRYFHTATALPDGRVLVTGGVTAMGRLPMSRLNVPMTTESAELFDPKTLTFNKGPDMKAGRVMHTATRLADGSVVILGGESLGVIERYDPKAGRFEAVGHLARPRVKHDATRLADGRVLVSGGMAIEVDLGRRGARVRQRAVGTLEAFDPATGKVEPLKVEPAFSRIGHDALLEAGGTVLLVGGNSRRPEVERLDVTRGTVETVGKLNLARDDASALLLDDGRVLVAGGNGPGRVTTDTVEVFDPATGKSVTLKDRLASPASDMSMVRLGRRLVLIGGEINRSRKSPRDVTLKDVNLVDLETFAVIPLGKTNHVRDDSVAWPLGDGSVLVCGGEDDDERGLTSAERLTLPGGKP